MLHQEEIETYRERYKWGEMPSEKLSFANLCDVKEELKHYEICGQLNLTLLGFILFCRGFKRAKNEVACKEKLTLSRFHSNKRPEMFVNA